MQILRNSLLFIFLTVCWVANLSAQKEGNYWYFGNQAGVEFGSGSPVAETNSAMITDEGCATISNALGNLLFYTDGQEVYDRNHNQMPNGFGLRGNASSTQSGVIVPRPGSTTDYYIFTVDNLGQVDGLQYSEVDLTLNGGNGDVTTKNVSLLSPTTEKVTAVNHQNQQDFWVITHQWNSNSFYAYEVTSAGVNTTPVISNVGTNHTGIVANTLGYLKASPKGDKLALAVYDAGLFEVFDFDNSTGTVSNAIVLQNNNQFRLAYGVEFSPNGERLYGSVEGTPGDVYQFDLTAGNQAQILASAVLIATEPIKAGALQLGPDGKIYLTRQDALYLDVIPDPNALGTAAGYQFQSVFLGGKQAKLGLPTFIQSFFVAPEYEVANLCEGDATQFTLVDPSGLDSVLWDFGDPGSGPSNSSTQFNPTHTYPGVGTYYYSIVFYANGLSQTFQDSLVIHPHASLDLGPDRVLCEGDTLILDATNPEANYLWQDGSTNPTFTVTSSGLYTVTVENFCDTLTDNLLATFNPFPQPVIYPGDTVVCPGEPVTLSADPGFSSYAWNTGETGQSITVTEDQRYSLIVTNAAGCKGSTGMRVFHKSCADELFTPNAFTPNGDGRNDIFQSLENGITLLSLDIYDRWGNLIFNSTSAQTGWDGTWRGVAAPEGVYSYVIQYQNPDGTTGRKVGTVTLLR